MASVSATITYPTQLPAIPWDRGQQVVEGDPLALAFMGVYDNSAFSANVTFGINIKRESSFFIKSVYSQTIKWAN